MALSLPPFLGSASRPAPTMPDDGFAEDYMSDVSDRQGDQAGTELASAAAGPPAEVVSPGLRFSLPSLPPSGTASMTITTGAGTLAYAAQDAAWLDCEAASFSAGSAALRSQAVCSKFDAMLAARHPGGRPHGDDAPAAEPSAGAATTAASSLLDAPIEQLLERVEAARERDAQRAALAEAQAPAGGEPSDPGAYSQWVDKHAPHRFPQLLSDDALNRDVLRWVKLWDKRVFKRSEKKRARVSALTQLGSKPSAGSGQPQQGQQGRQGQQGQQAGQYSSKPGGEPGKSSTRVFSWGWRPNASVLLLVGPPGAGKTTLANVVAGTAGYRPVEINASDDRSKDALMTRVTAAMTSGTLGKDQRPAMLILDEADGMEASGMSAFMRLVRGTKPVIHDHPDLMARMNMRPVDSDSDSDSGAQANAAGGPVPGKRRRGAARSRAAAGGALTCLTRPVVCIANDLYAPVLRELRQVACVVRFEPPSEHRLVDRLTSVLRQEHVSVAKDGLYGLARQADNDIRSCLHTLQFITRRANAFRWSADGLAAAAKGCTKDVKTELMSVWQDALVDGSPAKRTSASMHAPGTGAARAEQWARLSGALYSLIADSSLVFAGLHENWPRSRAIAARPSHAVAAADWLAWADSMTSHVRKHNDWGMMRYVPAAGLGVHLACRSTLTAHAAWPKQHQAAKRMADQRRSLLRSLCVGMAEHAPGLAKTGIRSARAAILERVPFLITMFNPPLRPVSMALYNSAEKRDLAALVSTLQSYGCTYTRNVSVRAGQAGAAPRGGEGLPGSAAGEEESSGWHLTPELHLLISYAGQDPWQSRPRLPDVLRQVVAHEVRLATLRAAAVKADASARQHRHDEQDSASQPAPGALPAHVLALIGPSRAKQAAAMGLSQDAPSAAAIAVASNAAAAAGRSIFSQDSPTRAQAGMLSPATARAAAKSTFLSQSRAAMASAQLRAQPKERFSVYFQFLEGYTHAIHRPVTLSQLQSGRITK